MKRRRRNEDDLPPVVVVQVTGLTKDGNLYAKLVREKDDEAPVPDGEGPEIIIVGHGKKSQAPGIGDRALVRMEPVGPNSYEARCIRVLPKQQRSDVLGMLERDGDLWFVIPTSKKERESYVLAPGEDSGLKPGELVRVEKIGAGHQSRRGRSRAPHGAKEVRIVERFGRPESARAASMIAIHEKDIPYQFPPEATALAEAAGPPTLSGARDDLRKIPLVTIDGEDARDFDDAVWAEADVDPENPGGWHLIVAIADVAHYVRTGDALDEEAKARGNSVYFPDRVVPMLPEALSNGLCSLVPNQDRYCLAMHLWIDKEGNLKRYRLMRGLMRSAARLTYAQVQRALDGSPDDTTKPLMRTTLEPLRGVYHALKKARKTRGALEIDLPEYYFKLDEKGRVTDIHPRERYDSHMLIEECMISANVAAAELLKKLKVPALFRAHETPEKQKLQDFRNFLEILGHSLGGGESVHSRHYNELFVRLKDHPVAAVIHTAALRSQMQAYYTSQKLGHFGLALEDYAHFTSPIRRYSDLIVHRALIRAVKLGEDALKDEEIGELEAIGEHISMTERRAMEAERDARDRYSASFLEVRQGEIFTGIVSSVTRFGMFITLTCCGADGLLPMGSLPDDYYMYDEKRKLLRGRRSGMKFHMGDRLKVRLEEASALTGGIRFSLVDILASPMLGGAPLPPMEESSGRERYSRGRRHGGGGNERKPRRNNNNGERGGRDKRGGGSRGGQKGNKPRGTR